MKFKKYIVIKDVSFGNTIAVITQIKKCVYPIPIQLFADVLYEGINVNGLGPIYYFETKDILFQSNKLDTIISKYFMELL